MDSLSLSNNRETKESNIVTSKNVYPFYVTGLHNRNKERSDDAFNLSSLKKDSPRKFISKIAHQVLKEVFSFNPPISARGHETLSNRVKRIWKTIPLATRRIIFGRTENEKQYRIFVTQVLQNYLCTADLTDQPLFTYDYFEAQMNDLSKTAGRIDRANQGEKHEFKIVEYKARKAGSQCNQTLPDSELPIRVYALLIKRTFPNNAISSEIHFLEDREIFRIILNENLLRRQKIKIEKIVME